MALPDNYFSRDGIGTLAGSSMAVFIVTTTVSKVAPAVNTVWVPFLLSIAIGLAPAISTAKDWMDYVIGTVNGCLIFLTATGGNSAAGAAETKIRGGAAAGDKPHEEQFRAKREKPKIFKSWFD
jgi:hypothetical protein